MKEPEQLASLRKFQEKQVDAVLGPIVFSLLVLTSKSKNLLKLMRQVGYFLLTVEKRWKELDFFLYSILPFSIFVQQTNQSSHPGMLYDTDDTGASPTFTKAVQCVFTCTI